ncbi:MAG: hypothetical protein AABY22_21790, partial [Nanoarchaeota archaeon]
MVILTLLIVPLISSGIFDLIPVDESPTNSSKIIERGLDYDLQSNPDKSFTKTIFGGVVNAQLKNGSFMPFEDFINVSFDILSRRIKIEDLDGNICYIGLNFSKSKITDVAIPSLNLTKNRGNYYFTTNTGVDVDSMNYTLDCPKINYNLNEEDLILNDNVKIDFTQAREQQN